MREVLEMQERVVQERRDREERDRVLQLMREEEEMLRAEEMER